MDNVIKVNLGAKGPVHTAPCYQYDQGRVIEFSGRDLSASFEVDFSNSPARSSITQIGTNNRITVPDQYFVSGEPVYVYLIAVGVDYAVTENPICIIPVLGRSARTNEEPTPSQESALDQAIAALNDAVKHSPKIEDGDWYVWDISTGAWVNTGVQAEGQDGVSPTVGIGKIGNRITITFTDVNGEHSFTIHDGEDGVGIQSIEKTATAGLVDTYTVTLTNGQTAEFTVTNGANGTNGTDGVSPVVTVTDITGGHRVTITDAEHPNGQVIDVMDGADGQTGPSGADGHSPTASVSKNGSTATITITDKNGTTTATVSDGSNGSNGQDGQPGADGYSPTASVTKSGSTATITITDKNGTTTETVSDGTNGTNGQDGAPGQDGADGVSPAVTVSTITGGHSVTITDKDHPSGQSFNVLDGTNGTDGQDGADGTTFTPSVAANGDLSWSNDGGKTNPTTVNIKGPQGDNGAMVVETVSGATPSITGVDNHRYVCGEVSTLSVQAPASGCIDVVFTSGSTPTVLTVTSAKSGVTAIKWANGWDGTCEANTVYEINILDGEYGVVGSWT